MSLPSAIEKWLIKNKAYKEALAARGGHYNPSKLLVKDLDPTSLISDFIPANSDIENTFLKSREEMHKAKNKLLFGKEHKGANLWDAFRKLGLNEEDVPR